MYKRQACDIASRAFEKIIQDIRVGVTEKELASKLSHYMVMEGADTKPYGGILISGARTSLPVSYTHLDVYKRQIVLGVLIGLLLGIIAAMKRGGALDYGILIFCMFVTSVPSLVIALILQLYFAGDAGLLHLPIIGWPKGSELWFGGWEYTILPTIAGALFYVAAVSYTHLDVYKRQSHQSQCAP